MSLIEAVMKVNPYYAHSHLLFSDVVSPKLALGIIVKGNLKDNPEVTA